MSEPVQLFAGRDLPAWDRETMNPYLASRTIREAWRGGDTQARDALAKHSGTPEEHPEGTAALAEDPDYAHLCEVLRGRVERARIEQEQGRQREREEWTPPRGRRRRGR